MFISAILKPERPTHRTVRNLLTITEVYAPEILLEETTKHLTELAIKKGTPVKELHARIKLLNILIGVRKLRKLFLEIILNMELYIPETHSKN